MTNFFSKPKPANGASAMSSMTSQAVEVSTSKSDFEKSFKSFALKKGVDVAPINLFRERRRVPQQKTTTLGNRQVIILDDDQVSSCKNSESNDTDDVVPVTDQGLPFKTSSRYL
jgi:chromatin assembly factor 1 subunit A